MEVVYCKQHFLFLDNGLPGEPLLYQFILSRVVTPLIGVDASNPFIRPFAEVLL